jgi:hypothetical protein
MVSLAERQENDSVPRLAGSTEALRAIGSLLRERGP